MLGLSAVGPTSVIVDGEATPARTYDEVAATKTMIERTERRFDVKSDRLAADTAYGTGKFLGWLVGAGITPHIPVCGTRVAVMTDDEADRGHALLMVLTERNSAFE